MSSLALPFRIGPLECRILHQLFRVVSAGALFPDAPPKEIGSPARRYGIDPDRVELGLNILLIRADQHLVLVDSGMDGDDLLERLRTVEIDPADLDTVILTHGHRDHVGGLVDRAGNRLFPNARYKMTKTEYEYWTDPSRLPAIQEPSARMAWMMLKRETDRIDFIGETGAETELLPGIRAIPAPGHTPGSIALLVESENKRLLHLSDAAHSPIQVIRSDWSSVFDLDKALAIQTRQGLFERAAQDGTPVLTSHFPYPGPGRIDRENGTQTYSIRPYTVVEPFPKNSFPD